MGNHGTPDALKAEIGNPHVEVVLTDGSTERAEEVLSRLGKPLASRNGAALVELEQGAAGVAPVVRALDDAGLAVASLELVEPTLGGGASARSPLVPVSPLSD